MLIALFGINDGALNLVVNLLVLFLVCVWLALIFWTYRDAKQRIEDPVLVMTATAASAIPFAGSVVYSILRPPEFLEDAKERALEIEAAELRLKSLRESSCPSCEQPIERDYLRCPACQVRVKDPCSSCSRPVDPRWMICPFCESALAGRGRRGASGSRGPSASGDAPSGAAKSSGAGKPAAAKAPGGGASSKASSSAAARSPTSPSRPARRVAADQPVRAPAPSRGALGSSPRTGSSGSRPSAPRSGAGSRSNRPSGEDRTR